MALDHFQALFLCQPQVFLPGWRKGTKLFFADNALDAQGFARQQWRARIETRSVKVVFIPTLDSPASNGGRGLKPFDLTELRLFDLIRPPAMAGAD